MFVVVSSDRDLFLSPRYEGEKHSVQGYLVLLLAVVLSAFDLIAIFGRLVSYVRGVRAGQDQFSFVGCWRTVVLDRAEDRPLGSGAEYTGLVSADPEELDAAELKTREIEEEEPSPTIQERRARFVPPINTEYTPRLSEEHDHEGWANDEAHHSQRYPQSAASERTVFEHSRSGSMHSDEALNESEQRSSWSGLGRVALLKKIGRAVFATAERILVFAGLVQVTTGIVIYTGGCRENYVNGCLAHLISAYLSFSTPLPEHMVLIIRSSTQS